MIGDGSQRMQPLYVKDLARIVATAAGGFPTGSRTFEVGGPEIFTMREIVEIVVEATGKRRPIVSVPVALAKAISRPAGLLPGSFLSPEVVEFVLQEALADNRAVLETFDVELRGFREGLSEYLH